MRGKGRGVGGILSGGGREKGCRLRAPYIAARVSFDCLAANATAWLKCEVRPAGPGVISFPALPHHCEMMPSRPQNSTPLSSPPLARNSGPPLFQLRHHAAPLQQCRHPSCCSCMHAGSVFVARAGGAAVGAPAAACSHAHSEPTSRLAAGRQRAHRLKAAHTAMAPESVLFTTV